MSEIDNLNNKINTGEVNPKKLMVASLDVKALYSNFDTKTAAKLAKAKVMKSDTK